MFIGGGSAGTAGGIKVTTFALLAFVMLAEIRGEPTVHVLGRRLPPPIQRQALTVALAAVGLVMVATVTLLEITDIRAGRGAVRDRVRVRHRRAVHRDHR